MLLVITIIVLALCWGYWREKTAVSRHVEGLAAAALRSARQQTTSRYSAYAQAGVRWYKP